MAPHESYDGMAPNASPTGWAKNGSLFQGNDSKTLGMQADFGKSQAFTAQFNLQEAGSKTPVFCEAVIEWSVEGNTVSRRISVASGTSISGVAQAVSVRLEDHSAAPVAGSPEYKVSVQVAPGTRPVTGVPPMYSNSTMRQRIVAGASTELIDLPPDLGACSVNFLIATVNATPILDQQVQATYLDVGGNPIGSFDCRQMDWAPLPQGVVQILVSNANAANVILTVSLGIDG